MRTTTFRIAKMDCAAEEQLVRMALQRLDGVRVEEIDLDKRTAKVVHTDDVGQVADALDALDLDTSQITTDEGAGDSESHTRERREGAVLKVALLINATLFVAEAVAGLISRSMGLLADSLDMLADSGVYALSLLAVGGTAARKKRLAAGSGYLQLTLAVLGLIEVVRRFLYSDSVPEYRTMVVVASIALLGNFATLVVLRRARSPEAHFQASWIFTSNDIKVNGLVIISAVVVAFTNNSAADLLAGAAIFVIVANGARRILSLAR